MIVYTVFPNEKKEEENFEKNISKLNAFLIGETLKKKEYNDCMKKKVLEKIIEFTGLTSS